MILEKLKPSRPDFLTFCLFGSKKTTNFQLDEFHMVWPSFSVVEEDLLVVFFISCILYVASSWWSHSPKCNGFLSLKWRPIFEGKIYICHSWIFQLLDTSPKLPLLWKMDIEIRGYLTNGKGLKINLPSLDFNWLFQSSSIWGSTGVIEEKRGCHALAVPEKREDWKKGQSAMYCWLSESDPV